MPWYKLNDLPVLGRLFSKSVKNQVEFDPAPEMIKPVAQELPQESPQRPPQMPISPQLSSPLFTHIPPEIRNYIFKFVLTAHDDQTRPYKKGALYYRPDHRYAQKIDTALLLTCRRIYLETEAIPASLNEHTSWYHRAPPDVLKNTFSLENNPAALKRRQGLETIHWFTQQFWLEDSFRNLSQKLKFTNATRLKITIRHTDWWLWENEAPLALDPKSSGRPSAYSYKVGLSARFEKDSWGNQFRNILGLKEFELELETVEKKKDELDAIIARTPDWEFPLGDGSILILNQAKTKRTGWVGYPLGFNKNEGDFDLVDDDQDGDESFIDPPIPDESDDYEEEADSEDSSSNDDSEDSHESTNNEDQIEASAEAGPSNSKSPTAKQKLVATGVTFIDEHLEPTNIEEDKLMTYYVVKLTWNARPGTDHDVQGDLQSDDQSETGGRKRIRYPRTNRAS